MQIVIDISAETYKAISELEKPNPKYAAEYMLYQFVKNGKRIEQTNCTDAISRTDAIRVASGYCHWSNIPDELAKLPSVTPKPCEDAISRQAVIDEINRIGVKAFETYDDYSELFDFVDSLPSVSTEKTGRCKDCKWWKDSGGTYRRGIGAESQCPINRREVCDGNGYCYMYEPQESEE